MHIRPSTSWWNSSSSHKLPELCRRSIVSTSSQHGYTSPSVCLSTGSSQLAPQQQLSKPNSSYPILRSLEIRHASSSSNSRWLSRQKGDRFAREAKVNNLKSRAAFKLLQINDRYRIFRPGQTVVDLGFAPGSWSQVAIDLVRPGLGRVVGVDVIPVAPPKGVNGIQGNFLSPNTQERVRSLLRDENMGRATTSVLMPEVGIEEGERGYVDRERDATSESESEGEIVEPFETAETKEHNDKVVDVVLSDMSEPWEIFSGLWKNSLSNPYYRMMNTSGNKFKDHAGSMDLCRSALYFAHDTLKVGGHFVCKFYQGAEDKAFEKQMKAMFSKVHREKPESSRSESKESFFVGIKRLAKVDRNAVFDEGS